MQALTPTFLNVSIPLKSIISFILAFEFIYLLRYFPEGLSIKYLGIIILAVPFIFNISMIFLQKQKYKSDLPL